MGEFKTTIGLEIHVQLDTKSKMFCGCDNNSENAEPNTNVCPVCLGMPGTLPVANKQAIEWTIKTGLALNCEINKLSKFDRKHYFYPDLPKGFQISQYDEPFCKGGLLEVLGTKVRLNRIHLEEDAGKLVHRGDESFVDLNRASTPLMEIVTEPDIESPEQAKKFLQELQLIIRYLGVSEASMEKGHLRCDANISLKDENGIMSPIVEIKNLNSFRFVERALKIEEKRLAEIRDEWPEKNSKVTRGYDSVKDETYAQRQKEEAADYRYFPEPDVPPIDLENSNDFNLEEIKNEIKSLPSDVRKRMVEMGLSEEYAEKVATNPDHMKYLYSHENLDKELVMWVTEEVNAQIDKHKISYDDYTQKVPMVNLADLVGFVKAGKISLSTAKEVFSEMIKTGKKAFEIVEEKGLEQISDQGEIEKVIEEIINESPTEAAAYKAGKKQLIGFFVGQVMKKTSGKANPKVINEILVKKLEG